MKEAVVLIIDANYTMNRPLTSSTISSSPSQLPSEKETFTSYGESSSRTRLECAKDAAIGIVSDLMIRSKTNEVEVIVLNTTRTQNYFHTDNDDPDEYNEDVYGDGDDENDANHGDDISFPNITQFSGNGEVKGVRPPTPGLLRKIASIQAIHYCGKPSLDRTKPKIRGDFVNGIILAADSLHRKTAGKQFFRRIILLTDAEHKITAANQQQLLVVLDALRAMKCQLEVVGIDFELEGHFTKAAPEPGTFKDGPKGEDSTGITDGENSGSDDDDDDDGSATDVDEGDSDDEEDDIIAIKRDNEQLLINLAEKTGGFVFPAREIQDIFEKILGSRTINPTKRKLIIEIAPGLVLDDARYYLLLSKTSTPTLKKKLAMVEEGSNGSEEMRFRRNALGNEMLQDFETVITHWNVEDENEEILSDRISKGYRFGSDILPFNAMDDAGLTTPSPVKVTILGYMDKSKVPDHLRIAPPYVLTGNDSRRCCAAISALARALQRTKKVAIGVFVKTKDRDPILCGLFPFEEGDSPLHLLMMQLPFNSEVRIPQLKNFDDVLSNPNSRAEQACDDLIDSLMIPNNVLDYTHIPNPKIRSFYRTAIQRVLNRDAAVVRTRKDEFSGPMATPAEIRRNAQPALEEFYRVFRLKKMDKGKPRR